MGDIVADWGDQIFTKISEKVNALTDFDAIRQIIDATIEEDCDMEDCPSGNTRLYFTFNFKIHIFYFYIGTARQPNPDFIPESNGCGSHGVQVRL